MVLPTTLGTIPKSIQYHVSEMTLSQMNATNISIRSPHPTNMNCNYITVSI